MVVADEPKSAAYLRKGLSEHGYVADVAGNGEEGLYLARNSAYDLVILGGLVTLSTTLNLLVLPALSLRYGRFEGGREREF